MSRIRIKSLLSNFKKWAAVRHEHIDFIMSDDPGVWYVRLRNFDGCNYEFKNGEYLVKVVAKKEYPHAPPEFYFMTPNGVYGINTKVCISIGEYHKSDYPSTLGMGGFISNLVSGMIGWESLGHGISIIRTDNNVKKKLAAGSVTYNYNNHKTLVKQFNNLTHGKLWTLTEKLNIRSGCLLHIRKLLCLAPMPEVAKSKDKSK